MTDFFERSLIVHRQLRGKIGIYGKLHVTNHDDLSIAYTPGVARPCQEIARDPTTVRDLTVKRNSVAVVSDGSAVLGLGNIGASAAIPVMEGKALLFREFANLDAWPICIDTQDVEEIVITVRRIAPVFGGINLEDISAPRCFEVESRLQDLGIPVFHDDQHGTAVVVLAALINAVKVMGREMSDLRVVVCGAGAAGTAIVKLLRCVGQQAGQCTAVADVVVCDSRGVIHRDRNDLPPHKQEMLEYINRDDRRGSLHDAMDGTDVFIGVSRGNLIDGDDICRMADNPIVLAMANPIPEIMPDTARAAGAAIVGTGRSDFPNQVNNVLAFPGLFRGAIDANAPRIDEAMKIAAAHALGECVVNLDAEHILPDALDRSVAHQVARAVIDTYRTNG